MPFALVERMNTTKELNMLNQILKSAETAMLTTSTTASDLHGRPMHIADVSEEGEITFLTSSDSDWLKAIDKNDTVGVSVLEAGHYAFINGLAVVETSVERIKSVWKSSLSVWFPDGPARGVVMVTVMPVRAEYWDVRGGSMVRFAWEYAKAKLTGSKIDLPDSPDIHGTVARP